MFKKTKMYFSGSLSQPRVIEHLTANRVNRLFTFASPKETLKYLRYCEAHGRTAPIMMDSGAFTAWSLGKPVRLQDLINYDLSLLRQHPSHEYVFIALDVIPGERGRMATESEISTAIKQSFDNYMTMREALHPATVLPVFHSGEEFWLRDRYLRETDYICLSPNQNMTEAMRFKWAREAANVPGMRFHGLATTGNRMLKYIDWYSVDSSSCLMFAAMGSILMPVGDRLVPVAVSEQSSQRKVEGRHLSTMHESSYLIDMIEEQGYDAKKLAVDHAERVCWNIDQWIASPWIKEPYNQRGLFQ